MATLNYCFEKLSAGVLDMAQSTDSLQDRLLGALFNFGVLHEGDFPSDLAPQFAEITKATTKIPPVAKEGSYTATISKMSDEEARKIIEKLFMLYEDVAERYHQDEYENNRPA